jgi:hypothetical protein
MEVRRLACMSIQRTQDARPEAGFVLPLVAVSIIALFALVSLVFDAGTVLAERRKMRTAADAGALAAAHEVLRGQTGQVTAVARAATTSHGYTHNVNGVVVTVNHPPAAGFYVGNADHVEVRVSRPSSLFFARAVSVASLTVPARAVATAAARGENCVIVLDPAMANAFELNSSSQMNLTGCGVAVNSNHSAAFHTTSSARLTLTGSPTADVEVVGGWHRESSSAVVGTVTQNVTPPAPDPLAYLTPPAVGSCTHVNWSRSSGTHNLTPGVYCGGITLANSARANLAAGMYIIAGGGIEMQSNSRMDGTGVTFFLTQAAGYPYQPLSIQSNAQMNLSAPTSGAYSGILFYQNPSAGSPSDTHTFQSSSTLNLTGALYFPTQVLHFQSSTSATSPYLFIISRSLELDSSANLRLANNTSGLTGQSPIRRVTLVE